ncbi:DUF7282 domain-containing protein [Halocalculus aciditolerans]|uniref:DUF7282 domain-containing protein n=1 Tax=Halocalculus aciditolerans TaxID=1383812 RepID=A0A830FPN2_9EURY|nr:hypothetical protein [Halocalculus aciditolerans]GGL68023.1 hypothetical protein GCM10009039_27530 [Halocalculus aciditolerans]
MSTTLTTQRPLSAVVLSAFLLLAAVAGVATFGGTAAAANTTAGDAVNGAIVDAQPARVGANSTHETHLGVDAGSSSVSGSSWTGYRVNYDTADVSDVDQSDLLVVGIDAGNDDAGRAVDTNAMTDVADVSAKNNGHSLVVTLGGQYDVENGDELVVVYEDVQNPSSAQTEPVNLVANPQSSDYDRTDNVTYHPPASVALDDQTVNGSQELTVASAYLPEGGSVTVQNASGTQVASTGSLDPGSYENLTVTLPADAEPGTYTAVARQPDGDAYATNDGSTVTDDGSVALDYDFAAAFEDSTRTNADHANLTLTADHGGYDVRVSADNLTASDLRTMFGDAVVASSSSQDTVTVPGGESVTHELNVSDYTGDYTFHATDLQTDNSDDAALTLTHEDTTTTTTDDTTTTTTSSDTTTTTTDDTTTTTTSSDTTTTTSDTTTTSSDTSDDSTNTDSSNTDSSTDDSSDDTSSSSTDSSSTNTGSAESSDETAQPNETSFDGPAAGPSASVTFANQTLGDDEAVRVGNLTLPDGGYVVLEAESGRLVGHTSLLDAGDHANVTVTVDALDDDTRLTAVTYENTDNATAYTQNDTAYERNGTDVTDTALIRVVDDQQTTTAAQTRANQENPDPRGSAAGLQWIALLVALAIALVAIVRYRMQ